MTFRIPWVISDVTEVPLEVARMLAYAATGGGEGVVGPGDLQVRALATPGGSVRIAPGAFAALNNFPGNDNQTYIGWNDGEVTKAVTATGGATRYDLVYVRIWDGGQTNGGTSGIASIEIAQNVASTAETMSDAGLGNIAGIPLARIAMPASTSTVQQSYITDLRRLFNPRRREVLRIMNLPNGSTPQNLTNASFVNWPSQANWTIDVPDWAVRAQVVAWIAGYQIVEGGTTGANVWGQLRVQLGTLYTAATDYNHSVTAGLGQVDAASSMCAGDLYIPADHRGTSRILRMEGLRSGSSNVDAFIRTNWGTVVTIQVIFYEDPDDQYWEQ